MNDLPSEPHGGARDAGPATRPAPMPAAKVRNRLFSKYVVLFAAVVTLALLANGIFDVWFYYQEHKTSLVRIQREQAEAAAAKIGQFIREIESQLGWTTQLPWSAGSIEQRRFDALRLLRQVPAITELSQLDATGKERLRVSRLAMDVVGSGTDYSKDPEIHRSHGAQGLLRTGIFSPGVGTVHDARHRGHTPRRGGERRGSESQADLGRGFADQGRRARQCLCRRRAGAADRASGHQPRPAQHGHVEPGAGEVGARRRCRRECGGRAGSQEHSRAGRAHGLRAGAATRLADVRRAPGRGSLCPALRRVAAPRVHPARRARVCCAVRHVPGPAHGRPHSGLASRRRAHRQRRPRAAHLDQDRRRAGRARQSVQRDGRAARGVLCGPGREGGGAHARACPVGRRADGARRGHPRRELDARPRNAALHHRCQGSRAVGHGRRRHLGAGPGNGGVAPARDLRNEPRTHRRHERPDRGPQHARDRRRRCGRARPCRFPICARSRRARSTRLS